MSSCCLEEDDGYDSVGEDAELELSCALHDLALRVKSFEENMRDRFHAVSGGDGDDDEITEDIPEMDGERSAASPKTSARGSSRTQQHHRQRAGGATASKQSKQQADEGDDDLYHDTDDDEQDDGGYDSDDEDSAEDETPSSEKQRREEDWDFQEQKEELSEMRHNIALLLQGIKAEAKALESHELELDAADDNQ